MSPRRLQAAATVVAAALVLAACAGGGDQKDPVSSEGSGSPRSTPSPSTEPTLSTAGARLTVAPTPMGQDEGGTAGLTPVTATYSPAHSGDSVRVQVRNGGGWRTVGTGAQDSSGSAVVQADLGTRGRIPQVRAISGSSVTPPVRPQRWREVFSDDFSGRTLDPTKWGYRVQPATGLRQCSTPVAGLVDVNDGHATLRVQRVGTSSGCRNGVWHNAMIATSVSSRPYLAKYGVFAARVRFQHAQGMHGSFWLQGDTAKTAEIDVAEYFGDGRADLGLSNFVHHADADGATDTSGGTHDYRRILGSDEGPADGFHVYSVQWTRTGYVFRIDGQRIFRTARPVVSSDPQYLILSLLTSDYELPRLKDPAATMKVDWVKAWQR